MCSSRMKQPEQLQLFSLTYRSAEQIQTEQEHPIELEGQSAYCFAFVDKGRIKATLHAAGKRSSGNMLSGELFLIPAGYSCTIQSLAKQTAYVTLVCFDVQNNRVRQEAAWYNSDSPVSCRMPQARSWMQDFLADHGAADEALYALLQSHLYAIVSGYIQTIQKPKQADRDLLDYVVEVQEMMLEQYNKALDIEEFARSSGTSANRFYQSFRWHTGLSPHKYFTKIRMDASLRLLAHNPASILDVAHSVGYMDEYYFSRLFKKHMGLTPSEYVSCTRSRIAVLTPVFKGDLAALGMTPCMSLERGWQDNPQPALRKLADARPDIILTGPVSDSIYKRLSGIAPVVMLHWKTISWKERLLRISGLFGLTSVAERWLSNYDLKVENAKIHIKNYLGETPVMLVEVGKGGYRVYGTGIKKMTDVFYDDLEVTPPGPMEQEGAIMLATIDEVEALNCEHAMFLLPPAITRSQQFELEQRWRSAGSKRKQRHCIVIRHDSELYYNASVHESLVEQTVKYVLSSN